MQPQNNRHDRHHSQTPAATFAEIVSLIAALQPLAPLPARAQPDEPVAAWLAQSQHRFPPRLDRPRLSVFIAPHGHAAPVDMPALLTPWQNGQAPAAQILAAQDEVELKLYEMATSAPTGNILTGPALSETMAAHAMSYGMMAAEPGVDLLCLSTANDDATGATVSALAVLCALLKIQPATLSLPDTVDMAVSANRAQLTDPLTVLATLGGYESCAILGAILAARLAQIPVVLEGLPALAAAMTLIKLTGANAASLLAHVRATSVPAWVQDAMRGVLVCLPDLTQPAGDGLQCAASLPVLRSAVRQVR